MLVTLGSTVTIVGRNYGSPRMVVILSVTVVAPISLGLILRGDLSHVVLGLLVVPFIFIITRMADARARRCCSRRSSRRRSRTSIAQRFDRALNTMSHGLVMLGPDGRVVVANAEAERGAVGQVGRCAARPIAEVAGDARRGERHARAKDWRYLEAQLTRALREGRDRKILVSLANGQHYEFSAQRRAARTRRHHLRGRDAARRGGGEDPLDGAVRQSDRPAQPRLLPRNRRRDDGGRRP